MNLVKKLTFSAICVSCVLLFVGLVFQEQGESPKISSSPDHLIKEPIIQDSRALEIRGINVTDKTSKYVTIKAKKYRWFADKEEALDYFKNMIPRQDYTVVYVDNELVKKEIYELKKQHARNSYLKKHGLKEDPFLKREIVQIQTAE